MRPTRASVGPVSRTWPIAGALQFRLSSSESRVARIEESVAHYRAMSIIRRLCQRMGVITWPPMVQTVRQGSCVQSEGMSWRKSRNDRFF